jgi:dienelactone hydrolase
MNLPRRWRLSWIFLGVLTCSLAALPAAADDAVIFRDGFLLRGRTFKEKEQLPSDLSKYKFDRLAMLDVVESGPKWYFFSSHLKKGAVIEKDIVREQAVKFTRTKPGALGRPLPALGEVTPGDFDIHWRRKLTNRNPGQVDDTIDQVITYLDTKQVYLSSFSHRWNASMAPSELGPDMVRKLLSTHPEARDSLFGFVNPERRIRIARFLKDCGWYLEARADLEKLKLDAPWAWPKKADDLYEEVVKEIDNAETAWIVAELEIAIAAGRWTEANTMVELFQPKTTDAAALSKLTELRAKVQIAQPHYQNTVRLLRLSIDRMTIAKESYAFGAALGGFMGSLVPKQPLTPDQQTLVAAAETVLSELHPDTAPRVQRFTDAAVQDERQMAKGAAPFNKPEELLTLAISAWLLGPGGAVKTPEWGIDYWNTRVMALAYLKEGIGNKRSALLKNWLATTRRRDDDETRNAVIVAQQLAQIIENLPPIDPEDPRKIRGTPVPVAKVGVPDVVKVTTGLTADGPQNNLNYHLRLPPEYHHGRSYPVIVALNHATIPAEQIIGGLAFEAARRGYIIAAPEWGNLFGNAQYDLTGKDHPIVLATIRDLARKFQVDPDRVFVLGFGEGANFALDLAMSKPDHFAGVVAMSPSADDKFYMEYWRNAQKLPVFTITGEMAGIGFERMRTMFERWLPYGYPMVLSVYRGRGFEWYGVEIPTVFDWLDKKKRVRGTASLRLDSTTIHAWRMMRDDDNRFYWIGGGDLKPNNKQKDGTKAALVPAAFWADIKPGNNIVVSNVLGLSRVVVWLEKDMIDWEKDVKVSISGEFGGQKPRRMTPDLQLMFEDLYRTGDRKMLFFGKLDFKVGG